MCILGIHVHMYMRVPVHEQCHVFKDVVFLSVRVLLYEPVPVLILPMHVTISCARSSRLQ